MRTETTPATSQEWLETAWRLRGPGGSAVDCVIVRSGTRLMLELLHDHSRMSRTYTVFTLRRARLKAEQWRMTLLSLSEFSELKVDGEATQPLSHLRP